MNAAGLAVAAGWEVASIHSNIKGVKWSSNLTALEAAGGRHLTLKQYHNGGTDWKNAHPEGRIQGNKAPWPEQWVECLVDLELKEEVMCANVTAKRDIVDETAYSTVFAKQSESLSGFLLSFSCLFGVPCSHFWQFNLISNAFAEAD